MLLQLHPLPVLLWTGPAYTAVSLHSDCLSQAGPPGVDLSWTSCSENGSFRQLGVQSICIALLTRTRTVGMSFTGSVTQGLSV